LFSQLRHRAGELAAPSRRFAEPERNRGWQTVRVVDPDLSGGDALDAPGVVAEEKNVAGEALDREVLVHLPDESLVAGHDDVIVRGLRNRPAVGDRGHARAAASAQTPVDLVAMNIRLSPPSPSGDAFGERLQPVVELAPRQIAVRIRAAHEIE